MQIFLPIDQLIRFYDHEDKQGNARHASAVTGVLGESLGLGLLRHHFEGLGASVSLGPGTPRRKGNWLDAWLHVEKGEERSLYRVEIKNWSAHSLGGKPLSIDADPQTTATYSLGRWSKLFDADTQTIKPANLAKVLLDYDVPTDWPGRPVPPSRPLACLWTAFHPEGSTEPFFVRGVRHTQFAPDQPLIECSFFSMSAYLRGLRLRIPQATIKLDVPLLDERLQVIDQLLGRTR